MFVEFLSLDIRYKGKGTNGLFQLMKIHKNNAFCSCFFPFSPFLFSIRVFRVQHNILQLTQWKLHCLTVLRCGFSIYALKKKTYGVDSFRSVRLWFFAHFQSKVNFATTKSPQHLRDELNGTCFDSIWNSGWCILYTCMCVCVCCIVVPGVLSPLLEKFSPELNKNE